MAEITAILSHTKSTRTRNIEQAITGLYSPFSFRNDDAALKATYFSPAGSHYQLQDRVKGLVKFQVGNILEPRMGSIIGSYDIIFCRNLLIYFDPDTRQQVIARLNQLLKPTGMLFVGHAESSLLLKAGWQGVRIPFTFAYQKSSQPGAKLLERASAQALVKSIAKVQQTVAITAPSSPLSLQPSQSGSQLRTLPQSQTQSSILAPASAAPIGTSPDALEQAQQLADRGEFTAAQQRCAQQLEATPLDPALHLLLGQIHQAQDQASIAEKYFGNALYLQPDCLAALVHLARLKQNRGDQGAADRLYERIERLEMKA
jgi:chemotaxis protein methyltransferase WspC